MLRYLLSFVGWVSWLSILAAYILWAAGCVPASTAPPPPPAAVCPDLPLVVTIPARPVYPVDTLGQAAGTPTAGDSVRALVATVHLARADADACRVQLRAASAPAPDSLSAPTR